MKRILLIVCLFSGWLSMVSGQTLPWPDESPNPDSYGYTWKTNSAAGGPSFDWVDITSTGTQVTGLADDNFVGPFAMGIDFPYYWLTKNEIWIGSNGFVSFEPINISSQGFGFPAPPVADGDDDLIAPYMTDLSLSGTGNPGEVWYHSDVANSRFIISFINVPYWTNNAAGFDGLNTFQVILNAADSTVTFQYLRMLGNWNSSYDAVTNPFVVGIEAITGNIGLSAPQTPVNASKKPVDSTAISFFAPSSPGPVIDAAVSVVENRDKQGFFVPWEPPPASTINPPAYRLSAEIMNQGSADITGDIEITATAEDTTGQIFFLKQETIVGGLTAGETRGFFFEGAFYPPFNGPYRYIVQIDNPMDFGDVNASNDVAEAEAVVIDTTQEEITLSYISDNINNALATGATPINWTGNTGNSGAGVFFDPFGYPINIVAVEFRPLFLQGSPVTQGFSYSIHGVDTVGNALPGPTLAADTLPVDSVDLTGEWTRVDLDTPITITSDGFYVGWFQQDSQMVLATEAVPPISRRSFEILDGTWSIWRDNSGQDIWIRAIINIEEAVFVGVDEPLEKITRFELYPNPSTGQVNIDLQLEQPSDLLIKILDMEGRKVWVEAKPHTSLWQQQLDLSSLSPGMYMVQLLTPSGQKTKRLIKY